MTTDSESGGGIITTCGHCGDEYRLGQQHDCTPECYHCGVTFDDLENPKYDNPKIDISRHQRECDERPEDWGKNIRDPEAEFRAERREREKQRKDDRRIREMRWRGEL